MFDIGCPVVFNFPIWFDVVILFFSEIFTLKDPTGTFLLRMFFRVLLFWWRFPIVFSESQCQWHVNGGINWHARTSRALMEEVKLKKSCSQPLFFFTDGDFQNSMFSQGPSCDRRHLRPPNLPKAWVMWRRKVLRNERVRRERKMKLPVQMTPNQNRRRKEQGSRGPLFLQRFRKFVFCINISSRTLIRFCGRTLWVPSWSYLPCCLPAWSQNCFSKHVYRHPLLTASPAEAGKTFWWRTLSLSATPGECSADSTNPQLSCAPFYMS